MSKKSKIEIALELENAQFNGSAQSATKSVEALDKSLEKLSQAQKQSATTADAMTKSTQNVASVTRDANGRFMKVDDAQRNAAASGTAYAGALGEVRAQSVMAFSALSSLVALVGAGAFLRQGIQTAREFSKELSNIASIAPNLNLNSIKQAIEQVNPALGTQAELANAVYFAFSAGVRGTEAELVKFSESVAGLAKGIGANVTSTMDAVTTMMNAYGLGVKDQGAVMDWFQQIVINGKTTGEALAPTIGQIASTAAAANVPINDLGAALATLTTTMPTAQSVTALNQAIAAFISPSAEATKTAEKLGLSLNAETLRTKGLVGALKEIKEATGGSIEVMAQLFSSIDAQKAVAALSGQFETLEGNLESFNTSAGVSARATNEQLQSLDAKFQLISNRVSAELSKLGDAVYPIISAIADCDKNTQNAIITAIKCATVITGIGLAVKGATTAWKALSLAIASNPIGASLAAVSIAITGIVTLIDACTDSVDELLEKATKADELATKNINAQYEKNENSIQRLERLNELQAKEDLTDTEKEEIKTITYALEKDFGVEIGLDPITGKLSDIATTTKLIQDAVISDTKEKLWEQLTTKSDALDAQIAKDKADAGSLDNTSNSDVSKAWDNYRQKVRSGEYSSRNSMDGIYEDVQKEYDKIIDDKYNSQRGELDRIFAQINALDAGDTTATTGKYQTDEERLKSLNQANDKVNDERKKANEKLQKEVDDMEKKITDSTVSESQKRISKIEDETNKLIALYEKQKSNLSPSDVDGMNTLDMKIADARMHGETRIEAIRSSEGKSERDKRDAAIEKHAEDIDSFTKSIKESQLAVEERRALEAENQTIMSMTNTDPASALQLLGTLKAQAQEEAQNALKSYNEMLEQGTANGFAPEIIEALNNFKKDYENAMSREEEMMNKMASLSTQSISKTDEIQSNQWQRIGGFLDTKNANKQLEVAQKQLSFQKRIAENTDPSLKTETLLTA